MLGRRACVRMGLYKNDSLFWQETLRGEDTCFRGLLCKSPKKVPGFRGKWGRDMPHLERHRVWKTLLCPVIAKVTSLVSETVYNKACAGFLWRTEPPEKGVVKPRCPKSWDQDVHYVSTGSACFGPWGQKAPFSWRGKAGSRNVPNMVCYKLSGGGSLGSVHPHHSHLDATASIKIIPAHFCHMTNPRKAWAVINIFRTKEHIYL